MTKYEKSRHELEILEKDFKAVLLPRLKLAADGKESLLFCISELNRFRQVRPSPESDQLFQTAMRIKALRETLIIPADQGHDLATAFTDCCKEYNNIENDHRRGAVKLAASLLKMAADEDA